MINAHWSHWMRFWDEITIEKEDCILTFCEYLIIRRLASLFNILPNALHQHHLIRRLHVVLAWAKKMGRVLQGSVSSLRSIYCKGFIDNRKACSSQLMSWVIHCCRRFNVIPTEPRVWDPSASPENGRSHRQNWTDCEKWLLDAIVSPHPRKTMCA